MADIVAYRIAGWDTPFWVSPNRWPRRFNKAGRGPVQYWALHPLGPLAEVLRAQGLRSPDALQELRLRVWVSRVKVRKVEEVNFDNAGDYGLEPQHLISDDYGACQELGDRCLREGDSPEVLEVPSAALPGTRNLVMFGPRVAVPYLIDPIGPTDVPTSICAEGSRAPAELLPLVRHLGEPHTEFEAWRTGTAFAFAEPDIGRS
ncbi:MAG TPA: RES domain-containing protein [Actinomycetota bacterium]|nr:RES domain-containing protein [Actinomycetota bacterium]